MTIARKRFTAWVVFALVDVMLVFGLKHRGIHAMRSLLLPGAGLYDHQHLYIGVAFTVAALVATVAWLQWGTDVILVAIVFGAMVTSAWVNPNVHATQVLHNAHEFPLVIIVAGAMSWVRIALGRMGFFRSRSRLTKGVESDINSLPPVERCQAVSIAALAGVTHDYDETDIRQRARRINVFARGDTSADAFHKRHAYARTARILTSRATADELSAFINESRASITGVPVSEPTWCRLLDATLAAIALQRSGHTQASNSWAESLNTHFAIRRNHRPSALFTPLAIRISHAAPWEHATALALAYDEGLAPSTDWALVRKSALGAAARGAATPHDQRLVAAGRMWAAMLNDHPASHILNKTTIGSDPLAGALNSYAQLITRRSSTGELT